MWNWKFRGPGRLIITITKQVMMSNKPVRELSLEA